MPEESDRNPLVVGIDSSKTKGVLSLASGILTYQAGPQLAWLPQGSNVVDAFDYIIQDIHGVTARATVTITNMGINQAPLTLPDSFVVQQGQAPTNVTALLLANDGDPNTSELSSLHITSLVLTGTVGSVELNNGAVAYTANPSPQLGPSQSAIDRFGYILTDAHGATATGQVAVTIVGRDLAPSAGSDVITIGSRPTM